MPTDTDRGTSSRAGRRASLSMVLVLCWTIAGCTGAIESPNPRGSDPNAWQGDAPVVGVPGAGGQGAAGGSGTPGPAADPCAPAAVAASAAETRIWRLNDVQYRKAVSDLLPGVTVPALTTPGRGEHEFVSWENQFPVQEAFASQLADVAYQVAQSAAADVAKLVTCGAGQPERECAGKFIDDFVTRAFRRPLTPEERDQMLGLYDTGAQNGTGFASGIELVTAAALQAPSFLYRTELGAGGTAGQAVALTAHELASSLSFLFLDSIPDAELWQTAVDGSLSEPAVLEQQIERLLALPRVREHVTEVVLSWIEVPEILSIEKTVTDLGGVTFDEEARQSMLGETRRFVHDALWNGGTIADLFQSRRAFVDEFMADFYEVTAPRDAQTAIELPEERAGLLARAGVIGAMRYGKNPEVFRGLLLREVVLCGKLQPPPPTVNLEAFNAQYAGLSTRERIAVRAGRTECAGCHVFMDTLGIAFDGHGALGQLVTQVNGVAPDPAGELTGTDVDGAFTDLSALSTRLAGSTQVVECIAEKMMTYALGRELERAAEPTADSCAQTQVSEDIAAAQGSLVQVFRGIAQSTAFTTRTVGAP